jgi:hypothetical protein
MIRALSWATDEWQQGIKVGLMGKCQVATEQRQHSRYGSSRLSRRLEGPLVYHPMLPHVFPLFFVLVLEPSIPIL